MSYPCCNIPPNGPTGDFKLSLEHDAKEFSKYVGGGYIPKPTILGNKLTSALHLEMKLWRDINPLPAQYRPNDAKYNAWRAMMQIMAIGKFTGTQQATIFQYLGKKINQTPNRCSIVEYDRNVFSILCYLRTQGLQNANIRCYTLSGQHSPKLSTVGRCQKLINIYYKYELSWACAGSSHGHLNQVTNYLCALHAPLDNVFLSSLLDHPIGQYLLERRVLRRNGALVKIRQRSDNTFRPWSKLDCFDSYFYLQWVFRKVAIRSWQRSGCNPCPCPGSFRKLIDETKTAFDELTVELDPEFDWPDFNWDWIDELFDEGLDRAIEETLDGFEEFCDTNTIGDTEEIYDLIDTLGGYLIEALPCHAKKPLAWQIDLLREMVLQFSEAILNRLDKLTENLSCDEDCDCDDELEEDIDASSEGNKENEDAKTQFLPEKQTIYIDEVKNYFKIVSKCGDSANLGLICKRRHRGEVVHLDVGKVMAAELSVHLDYKLNGSSKCNGGSIYVGGKICKSNQDALSFLKGHYNVKICSGVQFP